MQIKARRSMIYESHCLAFGYEVVTILIPRGKFQRNVSCKQPFKEGAVKTKGTTRDATSLAWVARSGRVMGIVKHRVMC